MDAVKFAPKSLFLLFLLVVVACKEQPTKIKISPKYEMDTALQIVKPLVFNDIIPDSLSDSLKVIGIIHELKNIENDSVFTTVEYVDSLNVVYSGFFRNDSLFKIIKGRHNFYSTFQAEPKITSLYASSYELFYFVKDSLVCSTYRCSSFQQTGRCNPVSISIQTFYYGKQIIAQEIDDNVGMYYGCGCFSSHFYSKQGETNFTHFVNRKALYQLQKELYREYDY
ncbi:MAG: hypothetical protein ACPGU5_04870 [Lishizhenia sp.]